MKITILDNKIVYYEDLIPDINNFINVLEQEEDQYFNFFSEWKDWYSSNSSSLYGKFRSGSFSGVMNYCDNKSKTYFIAKTIKDLVDLCVKDYCNKTNNISGHMPDYFSINKYNTNAYMGPHVDTEDKTVKNKPSLSMVFYLNDDYEGGEIEFPNQNIKIKPTPGSLIIFPSYNPYVHDPKPVKSGSKYMIPLFWFEEKFW
jgi:hypothetical protein